MSVKEEVAALKAHGYDVMVALQQYQQELARTNQQLQQKMNELQKESDDDRNSEG